MKKRFIANNLYFCLQVNLSNHKTMDGFEKKDGGKERDEVFSKAVRAGKRTYFFDVKSTRQEELYLTITESKKRFDEDGQSHFEKHKIFLYKEDFEKFIEGLKEVVEFIHENQGEQVETEALESKVFTSVEFDDFDEKK
jgi:hypothetical protein